MDRFPGKYTPYTFALLRIVSGLLFFLNGTQKFFGYPPHSPAYAPVPLNALLISAGGIELIAGFLILIGLFSGAAAFISSGEMAVAYFIAHQPQALFPTTNGGGLAVLYCFIFLYIASRGSGIWSIDSILEKAQLKRNSDLQSREI